MQLLAVGRLAPISRSLRRLPVSNCSGDAQHCIKETWNGKRHELKALHEYLSANLEAHGEKRAEPQPSRRSVQNGLLSVFVQHSAFVTLSFKAQLLVSLYGGSSTINRI